MRIFVDTNVFVYARDQADPAKHSAAREWIDALWASGEGVLSQQVLNEYYVTVTRKLDPPMPRETALGDVTDLAEWTMSPTSQDVVASAWDVEDRFGLSYWDALVVASAAELGCTMLLTEDLQHGQVLGDLTVVSPFELTYAGLTG